MIRAKNFRNENAVKRIIGALSSNNKTVRRDAAKSISKLAKKGVYDIAVVKPLVGLLSDTDKRVCHNAAFALGDLAQFCNVFDKSAISKLMRLASNRDDIVRWSTVFALKAYAKKGIFQPETVQLFESLLFDANKRVRYNAAFALGYLAKFNVALDGSTIYSLITLLSDRNAIVRSSAIFALECFAKEDVYDVSSVKPLVGLLTDNNVHVRRNVASALNVFREKGIMKDVDNNIVQQYNIHYGDKIGTQVKDSVVQRSNIGAGGNRKCPECGKEAGDNEKFCNECGVKL